MRGSSLAIAISSISFLLTVIWGSPFIRLLRNLNIGKIIRIESTNIRQVGRSTQGVCLVKMEEGDLVAAACVIPDTETEEAANGNGQADLPL